MRPANHTSAWVSNPGAPMLRRMRSTDSRALSIALRACPVFGVNRGSGGSDLLSVMVKLSGPAKDLAAGGSRKGIDEFDVLRHLEAGQPRPEVLQQFSLRGRNTAAPDHDT